MDETTVDRLARIESRLIEGFYQLGVDVKARPTERISLDEKHPIVYIAHTGTALGDILKVLKHNNAPLDTGYVVKCNESFVCEIFFTE